MRDRQNVDDRTSILLIPHMVLPVPAIKGGAILQLITSLIEQNERYNKLDLHVITKEDEDAEKFCYKNTCLYRYNPDTKSSKQYKFFGICYKLYDFLYRIFNTRLTSKIFKKRRHISAHGYFSYLVAKEVKPQIIVLDAGKIEGIDLLTKLVGDDNVFFHIHHEIIGDENFEKGIKNSISISEYVKKKWINGQATTGKHLVLLNGIPIDKFKRDNIHFERKKIRNDLGISSDEILCLFCGRIIKDKGVMELLNAFDQIDNKKIKLLVIGSPLYSTSTTSQYCEDVIGKIKNNPNIQYLGFIPNEEMPKYYAAADMQIVPSIWQEGAGLVTIEGMASGLPLIITESGGMVEYVTKDCSLQVPIDEQLPKNLASAIMKLAGNPELREEMGRNGIKRAELFSEEKYYENFVALIEDVQTKILSKQEEDKINANNT